MRAPVQVSQVELTRPLPSLSATGQGSAYETAFVLVRLHGCPLGTLELDLTRPMEAPVLADAIWRRLGPEISAHLAADGTTSSPPLTSAGLSVDEAACREEPAGERPFASVVVATHDRTDELARSLASLLAMDYAGWELIVVDSAPSSTAATRLVRQLAASSSTPIGYETEPEPGLSRARNRGLASAQGEIVAFTDDDAVVDDRWLARLVEGFQAAPGVGCVTGLSLPAELETPPQVWFEQFGGFGKGFERQIFDRLSHRRIDPLYPYKLGIFGSGLNMAFDRSVIRGLGGFDESLGAGSRVSGGEDLDAFLRIIMAGYSLVYEPRALVWHYHRRTVSELQRQLHGSGTGLSAVVTKHLLARETRSEMVTRAPLGLSYLLKPSSPKNRNKQRDFPRSLTTAELSGIAAGPFLYLYSRFRAHRGRAPA